MDDEGDFSPATMGEALQATPQTDPALKRPWTRPVCRPILCMHKTANTSQGTTDSDVLS